jgi:hypothetical protein
MTNTQAAEEAFARGNYRAAARLAEQGSPIAERMRIDPLPIWITLGGLLVQGAILALNAL